MLSWTKSSAHAFSFWCTHFIQKIPHGPNDIKKMTLVYGCHRSDPLDQATFRNVSKRASPEALHPIPHASSCPLPQADGVGTCTSQWATEQILLSDEPFPCNSSPSHKARKVVQTVLREPLFILKRTLPQALLLNRWTTPKIQQWETLYL